MLRKVLGYKKFKSTQILGLWLAHFFKLQIKNNIYYLLKTKEKNIDIHFFFAKLIELIANIFLKHINNYTKDINP